MSPPDKPRRGPPAKRRPTLFQRKGPDGKPGGLYYFTYRRKQFATGTRNRREADRIAAEHAEAIEDEREGVLRREQVTVGDVLDFYLGWIERSAPHRLKSTKAVVRTLRPFWAGKTLIGIRPNADGKAYCRSFTGPRGTERTRKDGALRADLTWLNVALKIFREAHRDAKLPATVVWKPSAYPSRHVWLSRDEVARICRVIRGRVWNAAAGDWERHPPTAESGRGALKLRSAEWRADMRFLLRLTLLGVYSGSRRTVMTTARWEPGPGHGHIEPVQTAFGDEVDFVRRGADQPDSPKRAPTIRFPRQARVLTRLWARNDRAGVGPLSGSGGRPTSLVIHRAGAPVSTPNVEWRIVRSAAGFGPEFVLHALRHTTATWLIAGGATVKEAADYIGVNEQTFTLVYLQVAPHFAQEAASDMDPRRRNPKRDPKLFENDNSPVSTASVRTSRPRGRERSG
jgi:integrase